MVVVSNCARDRQTGESEREGTILKRAFANYKVLYIKKKRPYSHSAAR
jgi:hypothetical protein